MRTKSKKSMGSSFEAGGGGEFAMHTLAGSERVREI